MIQAWSRVAIASWLVAASATGAARTPLMRTPEAGQCSRCVTFVLTQATDVARTHPHTDGVRAAPAAAAVDALPARHHKLITKHFRRRVGGLPLCVALRNELLVAGIASALRIGDLDLPAPSRDHARAPPASNHPA